MWRNGANNSESIYFYRRRARFPLAAELSLCVREAWYFTFRWWLFGAIGDVWRGCGSLGNGSIGFYGTEEEDAGVVEGIGSFWRKKEVMV